MRFGSLKLIACKYGWMLSRGPYIGKCFELYGQYSESEVAMMRRFLGDGGVAIDVGANIGDLTLPLAKTVGPAGRIYAIESNPGLFNVLCANLVLNGIENTKPINAFVRAGEGTTGEAGAWGLGAYIGLTWQPQFIGLDQLDVERCDLLKIDVDGPELDVLKSGEMLVERFRPTLYFENDHREKSHPLLDYTMRFMGYDLYWHPAPIFDAKNFFGNPDNAWEPNNIISLMMLGIPKERHASVDDLRKVASADEWWEFA
jgi:FkbM family methyltransferase